MKKRNRILLASVFLAVLAGIWWQFLRPREPRYQNRSATEWIQSLGQPNNDEPQKALLAIGMPALPYLVTAFENQDNRWIKTWSAWLDKAPAFARGIIPKPFPWRTIHGSVTGLIGSIGQAHRFSDGAGDAPTTRELDRAVRSLARALDNPDPAERVSCAQALAFIGANARSAAPALVRMFQRGATDEKIRVCMALGTIGACPAGPQAARALIDGLNSPDKTLTIAAANALGGIGAQAAIAVPALVPWLTEGDEQQRFAAVRALAQIGNLPAEVRPDLLPFLSNTNAGLRAGAAVALLGLDPGEATSIRVIRECLAPEKPPVLRSSTIYLMMRTKPVAEIFLPELQGLAQDQDSMVAIFARKALNLVHPESAVKTAAK